MSILQSASVVHSSQQQNGSGQSGVRRKKATTTTTTTENEVSRSRKSVASNSEGSVLSALSPLMRLIREPASSVVCVVEALRDQAGAEERAEKLRIEGRRRILYAKLKNV
jgi:hypothetical protein